MSMSAIRTSVDRLGKHWQLGRWRIPLRTRKNAGSKQTSIDAKETRRSGPSPTVSDLSSYKSDKPTPKDNKDAVEDGEVRNHVENPSPCELLAKREADLKEPDHGVPDYADKISEARPGPAPQLQQPIQQLALDTVDVKPSSTNPVSEPPWVAEQVLFTRGSHHNFPLGFINRGSFGSVFLVRHRTRGDLAAMKVVPIPKGESATLVREIDALTRIRRECNRFVLRQPLGVEDVVWTSDSGHLHLLFDLYIGDLHDYCGRSEVMDERFLGLVITELHSGLAHIHGLGFIHKDLKPGNILIDRDGHCVIADLGGCDIIPGISPTQSITRNSAGVITPAYAAPELYQRDESKRVTYTQAVDLWSLGATLCELITRSIPREFKISEDAADDDEGYSLQALGLEADNIRKTLGACGCPDGIMQGILELCHISPQKRLDIGRLDRMINNFGWNIPLGHYAPFPVDANKSAVVLSKGPTSIDSGAVGTVKDAAEVIVEFDTALQRRGLSVPKLGRFLTNQAVTKERPTGKGTI